MDSATPDPYLCRLEDIPDGGVLGVDPPDPEGEPLLLARSGNSVQAWLNVCPHAGRRMDVWAPCAEAWLIGQELRLMLHSRQIAIGCRWLFRADRQVDVDEIGSSLGRPGESSRHDAGRS